MTPDLFSERLVLASPLVRLRRGADEALLVPGNWGGSLHLRRGAAQVEALLAAAASAPNLGALLDSRPQDAELLRLLLEHRVLLHQSEARDPSASAAELGPLGSQSASLFLLLSQACNCACTYCLAGKVSFGGPDKPPRMTDEIARKAIERTVARLLPGGSLEVVFFGGEPTLNWPLARRLLEWLEQDLQPRYPGTRVVTHLTTNLVQLPPDLIELARRHKLTFLVDVDGPPDLHDRLRPLKGGGPSHARIADNLARLREAGLGFGLRATVTAHSVERMAEIVRHHKELGARGSALLPINGVDSDERFLPAELLPDPARFARGLLEALDAGVWSVEELHPFSRFLEQVRGHRQALACGAPFGNTQVVDTTGAVFPCIYWVGIERLALGRVEDPDHGALHPALARLREELHVDRVEQCRACELRYLCGGGCPVQRVALAHIPNPPREAVEYGHEIACTVARTIIERLLWREADGRKSSP